MRPFTIACTMLATTALLGACAGPKVVAKDYMKDCQWETRAKGTYTQSPDKIGANGLPVIVAGQGGDIRGALFMNACVERQHMRAGTLPGTAEYDDGTGG